MQQGPINWNIAVAIQLKINDPNVKDQDSWVLVETW